MLASRLAIAWVVVVTALAWWLWPTRIEPIAGVAVDASGPIASAVVRRQGERSITKTDEHGRFCLSGFGHKSKQITAWKPGYAIGSMPAKGDLLRLQLVPLPKEDNDDYQWLDPTPNPKQPNNCANCHAEIYREWSLSGHAKSATNPRVLDAFAEVAKERPHDTGVCAKCHAPTMRDPALDYDLRKVKGVDAHGVHCDYCHKVSEVPGDKFGTRFGNDGLQLLRPPDGKMLFFGPLDDAVREGEQFGYSPVYKDSRYCASCHEGVIYGAHVYGTYSEWLESPARKEGKQCQSCHMVPTGKMTNIAPGHGGIERYPGTLANHVMPGGTAEMLKRCLSVQVRLRYKEVEVGVKADNVGHRVPTGFAGRQLVLTVTPFYNLPLPSVPALAKQDEVLTYNSRPRLVVPTKVKVFAKQFWMPDQEGGLEWPVSFWQTHDRTSDTRLFPGKADHVTFALNLGLKGVRVQLTYLRHGGSRYALGGGDIVVFDQVFPSKK